MTAFKWTKKRVEAAYLLAEGHTQMKVAAQVGTDARTIRRWLADIDFAAEVDRLTLMAGIAIKAERIRMAKKAVRSRVYEEIRTVKDPKTGQPMKDPQTGEDLKETVEVVLSKRDLLDWLQYVQSETDGVKLDLTNLLAAFTKTGEPAPVADPGPAGTDREPAGDDQEESE